MSRASKCAVFLVFMLGSIWPATAQMTHLPMREGIWVTTETSCEAAANAYIYTGNRFGSIYLHGAGGHGEPIIDIESVSRVARGHDGFSVINEGPIEVAPRSNGRMVVRAYSPINRVQWSDTLRRCPLASLSPEMGSAILHSISRANAARISYSGRRQIAAGATTPISPRTPTGSTHPRIVASAVNQTFADAGRSRRRGGAS